MRADLLCYVLCAILLAACSGMRNVSTEGAVVLPRGKSTNELMTIDQIVGGPCSVSTDGFIWYTIANGLQPAIDLSFSKCATAATVQSDEQPPIPSWAKPSGPTKAIFIATSLQESFSNAGLQDIEALGKEAGVPITWLIGNDEYISQDSALYNSYHAMNGDDVELESSAQLAVNAQAAFPWYSPAIEVAGAGSHRDVSAAAALGDSGFWGITWNSHGTDSTSDEGAPWGTYCADPASYKRPALTNCSLLSFEWTARDLTRAYLANTNSSGYSAEAAFSTDPDDLRLRGGFEGSSADTYIRSLIDAYAAAGQTQPLVVMSQQESDEQAANSSSDDPILTAVYSEAISSGMRAMTLRQALPLAKVFSSQPRAVAFPYISGGLQMRYNNASFTPATIDFHDNQAGMTFIAGHTTPSRIFLYSLDTTSTTNVGLQKLLPSDAAFPKITAATVQNSALIVSFSAPQPMHFGIAIWADPTSTTFTGANVTHAGHSGSVITFDLPMGNSTQTIPCTNCSSLTFNFSV